MLMPVSNVRIAPAPEMAVPDLSKLAGSGEKSGEFTALLQGAIGGMEQTRSEAAQSVENFLSGEGEELHTTVLATQRAELSFELGLQVRNKIVQAYQEIMRMQL